jgi:predicted ABC-type ATPase
MAEGCTKLIDVPRILVFAGPNGSGKSSIVSAWEIVGIYINADDIKIKRKISDLDAAREAERLRESRLLRHQSFTFETVLSTNRNLDLLTRAKTEGYSIEGVFVMTANAELNVFRVKSREASGGHAVPYDKVRSRYDKALANIPHLLRLCDVFRIIDNTSLPDIIFSSDEFGSSICPNRYWSADSIEKLTEFKYESGSPPSLS